jgi:hypothetical protein
VRLVWRQRADPGDSSPDCVWPLSRPPLPALDRTCHSHDTVRGDLRGVRSACTALGQAFRDEQLHCIRSPSCAAAMTPKPMALSRRRKQNRPRMIQTLRPGLKGSGAPRAAAIGGRPWQES